MNKGYWFSLKLLWILFHFSMYFRFYWNYEKIGKNVYLQLRNERVHISSLIDVNHTLKSRPCFTVPVQYSLGNSNLAIVWKFWYCISAQSQSQATEIYMQMIGIDQEIKFLLLNIQHICNLIVSISASVQRARYSP